MHTVTTQKLTFRPDLQGLRALAILLVVFAHAGLTLVRGGFVGVDVFFVLSGYLITGLLLRELEQSGRIAFMQFYARRLKRLLPALISVLIVSSGLAIWLLSGVEARAQLASSPFAATWTSNLFFTFTTIDYFNELAARDLFLHTWSLGVEEQFYIIWPAFLLTLSWIGSLLQGANKPGRSLILPGLWIAFIASLSLSLYWSANSRQAAFYLMPPRIWQLSLGAIVYCLFRDGPAARQMLVKGLRKIPFYMLLGTGLILIIGSALIISPNLVYPGFSALFPSFGAALVIASGYNLPQGDNGPLAHPILVWLGDRSYSLYLWHWPILILGFSLGLQGQLYSTLGLMLLSMLAALLSFRLIEIPFWKGRWSQATSRRIILLSFLIMASAILATYHGLRQLPQAETPTDISNQWRADVPIIYTMPCDAWYANARVEPCVFGANAPEKTVVILGDSIGAQWFSMTLEIFQPPLWRVVVLTKSSCPMVDEDWYYARIGKIYDVCTQWRNAVLDELYRIKPDVLIMGSAATYDFSERQWIDGSSRVLERVSSAAKNVLIIPGTPSLGFDGPGCVARNLSPEGRINRDACKAIDRTKHIADIALVAKFLGQAAERFANVYLLNLSDLVCPGGICSAFSDQGQVVFRDSQHLTDSFVRAQIPVVRERMAKLSKEFDLSNSDVQRRQTD